MSRVQSPMIPIVGQWVADCPGTISLGQGVVHYPPPPEVARAVADAASKVRANRYGLVAGIDELLEAAQGKLLSENGIVVDRQRRVFVTAGSNMGFLNAVLAIADPEDEIVLLRPYYFNHEMAIEIAGCRPVVVDTDANYQLDVPPVERAITPRTRAVVTVSPNNPTGAVYPQAALTAVNRLCRDKGVYHISDEAYETFVYGDDPHFSPASLPESAQHTISLFSLSKAYGMAGWRTGYMAIPAQLESAVQKVQDTNLVCPPIVNQIAAAAALGVGSDWCRAQSASFREVRDIVLNELAALGERCVVPRPDGAFYVLAQLDMKRTDAELVERLIREFGVAVMGGRTFGVNHGCSVRIAYGALDRDTVAEGMGRLVRGLRRLL